jgi:chemotaxis protein MotB
MSSEDEGGGANWMDTYGDLVTLLLCFFVLLFSFSSVDARKWEALVGAFSGSTAVVIPGMTPEQAIEKPITLLSRTTGDLILKENSTGSDPEANPDDYTNRLAWLNLQELERSIREYMAIHNLDIQIITDRDRYIITMRIGSNVLFNSGEADLLPEALPVLDSAVETLIENRNRYVMVNIEGHTDNVPINTERYPDNWALSASRAVNTLRYIVEKDVIALNQLSAVGYGEYHPVESNETPEGRASNRRVDFVIQGVTEFD